MCRRWLNVIVSNYSLKSTITLSIVGRTFYFRNVYGIYIIYDIQNWNTDICYYCYFTGYNKEYFRGILFLCMTIYLDNLGNERKHVIVMCHLYLEQKFDYYIKLKASCRMCVALIFDISYSTKRIIDHHSTNDFYPLDYYPFVEIFLSIDRNNFFFLLNVS